MGHGILQASKKGAGSMGMRGGAGMGEAKRAIIESTEVQSGSLESIAVFEELEARREAVRCGDDRILEESESWALLKAAGAHV